MLVPKEFLLVASACAPEIKSESPSYFWFNKLSSRFLFLFCFFCVPLCFVLLFSFFFNVLFSFLSFLFAFFFLFFISPNSSIKKTIHSIDVSFFLFSFFFNYFSSSVFPASSFSFVFNINIY